MSFISTGRQSSTPSILKRPGKIRNSPGLSVKFQLDSNLKGLLLNFLTDKNQDAYVELICRIRDAGNQLTDEELIQILSEIKDCISILNEDLKLFVQVLLLLKWVHRSQEAVQLYKNFVLDLCSAHNCYTKFAVQQLVAVFAGVIDDSLHVDCNPSEQEEASFQTVHEVLKCFLKIIPMSKDVLLMAIKRKFPFRTECDRSHLNYVHNLLIIANYEPSLRREILFLIFTKLVQLDTMCSKDEILKAEHSIQDVDVFPMEVDDIANTDSVISEKDMRHETARKLDCCLYRLYKYIHRECYDKNNVLRWEKANMLYQDFLYIFENVILPTPGWNHTQFTIFYLISFKRKLTENFVNYLWNKVTNPNVTPVIREAAVHYLVGVLCHASFVSIDIIKSMLQNIVNWLHNYIDTTIINEDDFKVIIRVHAVFYATCQALLYLINLRHDEFVNSNKGLRFLTNLNLSKIVVSQFNALQVCKKPVVNQFIKITKIYQLAYCDSVLTVQDDTSCSTSIADLLSNSSFPFDCYLLTRSSEIINPIRRQITNKVFNKEVAEKSIGEEEDFIPNGNSTISPLIPVLGSSPYFSCAFGT